MKRGPQLTPVNIGQSGYFDVCAVLRLSYEEATRVVNQSPEVHAFVSKNALRVLEWPPTPEAIAAPAAIAVAVEATVAPAPSDETLDLFAAAEPEEEAARVVREPSMDWSEDELREYAAARGIDVERAKSKTAVLRTIRNTR